jgi:hypothetical protein
MAGSGASSSATLAPFAGIFRYSRREAEIVDVRFSDVLERQVPDFVPVV